MFSWLWLMVLSLMLGSFEVKAAEERLVIAMVDPENSFRDRWYRLVYSEAFGRLGVEIEFINYPMKRSPYLVNMGKADVVPARVYDFNTMYTNLLRVEEPLFPVRFSAYSHRKDIQLDSWDSLRNSNLRAVYRTGVKKCEEMLPKVLPNYQIEEVEKDAQGLHMLLKRRADVYVGLELFVEPLLKSDDFSGAPIYRVGVMEKINLHSFLHKKHEKLVPRLGVALKAMREEGLFERYDVLAARQVLIR